MISMRKQEKGNGVMGRDEDLVTSAVSHNTGGLPPSKSNGWHLSKRARCKNIANDSSR